MPGNVKEELIKIIMKQADLPEEQAKSYIKMLEKAKRYSTETWQ